MNKIIYKIKKGEGRTLEFKEKIGKSLKNIIRTIVAFSNDAGGELLIGVTNDGRIIGINEDTILLEEKISNAVYDSIIPTPLIFYQTIHIEGKEIFVIKVLPGVQKPYFLKSEGLEKGAYIRIGSTNRIADLSIINELKRQNLNKSYDEEIVYQYTCNDLSKDKIELFKKSFQNTGIENNELLRREKFVFRTNGSCYPTIGGLLLFCDRLPRDYEYAGIAVSVYASSDRCRLLNSIQLFDGLLVLPEIVINTVSEYLSTHIEIKDIKRSEQLEIPEIALREAIINAICHRDYSITGSNTKIDVFPDRVEITNPGNLPIGISLEDLGEGASEIRNKLIARAFRRYGYMEQLGTGISRMNAACHKAGLPEPEFEEVGRFFRVTIKRRMQDLQEIEKAILDYLENVKEAKSRDIAKKLEVHPNTILNYMNRLQQKGLIEKTGRGPNVQYKLKM